MSWSQLSFNLARKRGTSWGAHDLVMNRLLSWTSAISRFCWRNTCLSHTLLTQIPDVKLQMCELCVPLLVSLEWRIKECFTVWFNVARSLKSFKCLTHFSTSGRLEFLKCISFFWASKGESHFKADISNSHQNNPEGQTKCSKYDFRFNA